MSEPIQSIAQNNYILHNIDAKKLYVQEPLFTANSGDAVYVGWRPDETVLWSGARQTTGSIQLSDSMWNYDAMDIYVCPDYNTYSTRMGYQITRLTVIPQTGAQDQLLCYAKSDRIASNTYLSELFYLRFNPNGESVDFSPGIKWSNNTVTTGVTAFNGAVTKIIGINRKENA